MEYIETQVKDAVACCYINRNEVKNALNRTIIDELGAKIGSLCKDNGVRALIMIFIERIWEKNYDLWYNPIHFQRMTIQDMLHCSAAVTPDKVATDFYGTKITYYGLRKMSITFAQSLVNIGIKNVIESR